MKIKRKCISEYYIPKVKQLKCNVRNSFAILLVLLLSSNIFLSGCSENKKVQKVTATSANTNINTKKLDTLNADVKEIDNIVKDIDKKNNNYSNLTGEQINLDMDSAFDIKVTKNDEIKKLSFYLGDGGYDYYYKNNKIIYIKDEVYGGNIGIFSYLYFKNNMLIRYIKEDKKLNKSSGTYNKSSKKVYDYFNLPSSIKKEYTEKEMYYTNAQSDLHDNVLSHMKAGKIFNNEKIIDYKLADLNSDGHKEALILTSIPTTQKYAILKFYIVNNKNEIIATKKYPNDFLNSGYITVRTIAKEDSPYIFLNIHSGYHNQCLSGFTFNNNKLINVCEYNSGNFSKESNSIQLQGNEIKYEIINRNILKMHSVTLNKDYFFDVSSDKQLIQSFNYNKNVEPYVSDGPNWNFEDVNSDGIYELKVSYGISGCCNGDRLGNVNIIYKFDKKNNRWNPVDFYAKSDNSYPEIHDINSINSKTADTSTNSASGSTELSKDQVENIVLDIRKEYNKIENGLKNYKQANKNSSKVFYDNGVVKKIYTVTKSNSKEFYYLNNELIFAYLENPNVNSDRLYFNKGKLIRWIYEDFKNNKKRTIYERGRMDQNMKSEYDQQEGVYNTGMELFQQLKGI